MIRLKELFKKSYLEKCKVYLYTPKHIEEFTFKSNRMVYTEDGDVHMVFGTNKFDLDDPSDKNKIRLRYLNNRFPTDNFVGVEKILTYLDSCSNIELNHFEVDSKELIIVIQERK